MAVRRVVKRQPETAAKKPAPKKGAVVTVPQPPPIPNGHGRKFMKMVEPARTVEMDAGVFDYLWRVAESHYVSAKSRPGARPEHLDLMERAVGVFRRAATSEEPAAPSAGTRRVVRRR